MFIFHHKRFLLLPLSKFAIALIDCGWDYVCVHNIDEWGGLLQSK